MGDSALTPPAGHDGARANATGGAATGSLTDLLAATATAHPKGVALQYRRFQRRELVTFAALHDEVRTIAKGLAASGIQPGDRVAILAEHGPSWLVADLAAWYTGAVVVPLHPTAPAHHVEWALSDSGARAMFLGGAAQQQTFDKIADRTPNIASVWRLAEDDLDRLAEVGTIVGEDDIEDRRASVGRGTPATILYGPDGDARALGVVLTHGALGFAVESAVELLRPIQQRDSECLAVQSIHPAHALGHVAQLACLRAGVRQGFCPEGTDITDQLADLQPTLLIAAPATVEHLLVLAAERERAEGRSRLYDAAAAAAVAFSTSLDTSGPIPTLRARRALFDRTVYPRLRALLGGRLTHVICGGAGLEPSLLHTLRGAGVTVVQAYGPPQSAGLAALAEPPDDPTGSVIRPLPGIGLRLGADGEILIRGPQVFTGYFNEERASRAAFTSDGWLRTGDTGGIGDDGTLRLAV